MDSGFEDFQEGFRVSGLRVKDVEISGRTDSVCVGLEFPTQNS